jgi:hypothetical protein
VTFSRSRDGYKDGDMRIRQNFIDWRPSGNQFIYQVSWGAFAHFAEENGKRIRPKTNFVRAQKKLTNIAA